MNAQPDWLEQFSTYEEYAKWYTEYYYGSHNATNIAQNQASNTISAETTTIFTASSASATQQKSCQYGSFTTPQQVQRVYSTGNISSNMVGHTKTTPAPKPALQSASYPCGYAGGTHQTQHGYTTAASLSTVGCTTNSYYTTTATPANTYQYAYYLTPYYSQTAAP